MKKAQPPSFERKGKSYEQTNVDVEEGDIV